MRVGPTIYQALVKYAEQGEHVTKVVLPHSLYAEYQLEDAWQHTLRTLGVQVEEGKVSQPKFYTESP